MALTLAVTAPLPSLWRSPVGKGQVQLWESQAKPAGDYFSSRSTWLALVPAVPLSVGLRRLHRSGRAGPRSRRCWRLTGIVTLQAKGRDDGNRRPRRSGRGTPAGRRDVSVDSRPETTEEAILRLSNEISEAIESDDPVRHAKAQREMRKVQLEKPSEACRHLIHEDCRAATAMLRLGDSATMKSRIRSVRKLGRWLRWPQAAKKDLVPFVTILEGLLYALRSEPEVAWAAQCALFHAARCDDTTSSQEGGVRGIVTRLLSNEKTRFPFCLPRLDERNAEAYELAVRNPAVRDFLLRLRSASLIDPGYGDCVDHYDLDLFRNFSEHLGKGLQNLESLEVVGFEDSALAMVMPALWMPNLRSLRIIGACQTEIAQRSIVAAIHRHSAHLEELELNLWTRFLCEADDPLMDMDVLPKVRHLTIQAPPLPVSWEHLACLFPNLQELTFLYDQEFSRSTTRVLEECDGEREKEELLERHSLWIYRDAVNFANSLHTRGFSTLARNCPKLKTIKLAITDSSKSYDATPSQDRMSVSWRCETVPFTKFKRRRFRRNAKHNNSTRAILEARGTWSDMTQENWVQSDNEDDFAEVSEEESIAAGARVMLQVLRLFDDPSLEAEFGLRAF
mmetsp:Transcript_77552/g.136835  ORF Transcript_77552/g.136835 Transcript_77552/m.136835 type:complete len:621 (-) Transcript_77552:203-2065(-)